MQGGLRATRSVPAFPEPGQRPRRSAPSHGCAVDVCDSLVLISYADIRGSRVGIFLSPSSRGATCALSPIACESALRDSGQSPFRRNASSARDQLQAAAPSFLYRLMSSGRSLITAEREQAVDQQAADSLVVVVIETEHFLVMSTASSRRPLSHSAWARPCRAAYTAVFRVFPRKVRRHRGRRPCPAPSRPPRDPGRRIDCFVQISRRLPASSTYASAQSGDTLRAFLANATRRRRSFNSQAS